MKDGVTPVFTASFNGHTESLALLLSNKADANVAVKVQLLKIFKYLKSISCKRQALKKSIFYFNLINGFNI